MSEHPQQTDRALRDTRILTLRIWAVVGLSLIHISEPTRRS